MKKISFISTALLLSACQTVYETPAEGAKTATLFFDMEYDNGFALGTARSQEYRYVKDAQSCEEPALMAGSLRKSKEGVKILASEPIILMSGAYAFTGGYDSLTTGSCVNRIRFTPVEGRTYKVKQNTLEGIGCSTTVVDMETGKKPDDFFEFSSEDMKALEKKCSAEK